MEKAEIQKEIDKLTKEIENLKTSLNSYNNMNSKINETITKLTSAKNCANETYTELEKYYQNTTSNEKVSKLETEYTNIINIIKKLKLEILVESDKKIRSINSDITSKKNQISRLKEQLNNTNKQYKYLI